MKPGGLYWNHYFTVLISEPRLWVRWGYASKGEKVKPMHISPASTILSGIEGMDDMEFKFELADGFKVEGVEYKAREADRVESWGWKTISDDSPGADSSWRLGKDMDECLRQAMAFFRSQGLIPDDIRLFHPATRKTETVTMPQEWLDFSEEAAHAVDQWQTGKGWPEGWRGKKTA